MFAGTRVPVGVRGGDDRMPGGGVREVAGTRSAFAPTSRVNDRAHVRFQPTVEMPHHRPIGGRAVHVPVFGGHGAPAVVHHHHRNPASIHVGSSSHSWHSSKAGIAFWSTLAAIALLALVVLPVLLICLL